MTGLSQPAAATPAGRVPATLRDVARAAGVADSTVSRVLNGRDAAAGGPSGVRVPPQTRERIFAAARALNYRPSHAARSLRGGRTGVIAFVLPELDRPSAASVAVDGQRLAAARGYVAQVLPRGDDVAGLVRTLRFLRQRAADAAVVLAPYRHGDVEAELRALAGVMPLLLFLRWRVTIPGAIVGLEPSGARAALAVRHLIALGRRRIAYVTERRQDTPDEDVGQAYYQTLAAAGLPPGEAIVCGRGSTGRWDARSAVRTLLAAPRDRRPDAVYAGTTNTAIGAAYAIHEAGVAMPEAVALATAGDSPELEWIHPGITSVVSASRRPDELLGRFFEHLDDPADPSRGSGEPLELPVRLAVRGSTVRPAAVAPPTGLMGASESRPS
jgi:DNA-binding LacI/PurR family transcriptional regulator